MNIKKILMGTAVGTILFGSLVGAAFADTVSVNFENPPYILGNINSQDGWTALGSAGSGCAIYDEGVSSSLSTTGFGSQSFRISDAATSGCFGDQAFSKPLTDSVGETSSTNGTFSPGTKKTHFEMQFDFASAVPGAQQPGMHLSVSPDRGDGSRMSYLRFEDQADGIHVFFDDVTDVGLIGTTATFNESDIATISRSPHTVRLTLDTLDGAGNDIVKVYVDGVLKHTGTSWENYYRYDPEASSEQSPRIVKTVEFRESGDANSEDNGKGFLIDNLSLLSNNPTAPTVPTIIHPANGAILTSAQMDKVDWTDSTGATTPILYQYQAYSDAAYTSLVYDSGMTLANSEIPTPGTPVGTYYLRVRAQGSTGPASDWSNGSENPYKVTVSVNPFVVPAQCDQNIPYNLINGKSKAETINGTSGNDLIYGNGGADTINGMGGNDCIVGGNGADTLSGGDGNDVLIGGDGADTLNGGNGNDKLYGQGGADNLNGGNGDDYLDGGAAADRAIGGAGHDSCIAESKNSCEL